MDADLGIVSSFFTFFLIKGKIVQKIPTPYSQNH